MQSSQRNEKGNLRRPLRTASSPAPRNEHRSALSRLPRLARLDGQGATTGVTASGSRPYGTTNAIRSFTGLEENISPSTCVATAHFDSNGAPCTARCTSSSKEQPA